MIYLHVVDAGDARRPDQPGQRRRDCSVGQLPRQWFAGHAAQVFVDIDGFEDVVLDQKDVAVHDDLTDAVVFVYDAHIPDDLAGVVAAAALVDQHVDNDNVVVAALDVRVESVDASRCLAREAGHPLLRHCKHIKTI